MDMVDLGDEDMEAGQRKCDEKLEPTSAKKRWSKVKQIDCILALEDGTQT